MGQRLQKLLNAGNVLKAPPDKSGHCPRCRADVRTIRPWPHWRKVRYGYFAMLGVALMGAPVILVDGFVLIPSLMVFIAAIGPLNSLVAKLPTCATCGAPADKLRSLRLVASQPPTTPLLNKRKK
ncbi:MAG TPA: hypothetical protein VMF89_01830 [Polyangiales bacterium]|nr:hypothetical protein [Polyangiales bacterium]